MLILEHNCTTNEVIEREATDEEIAQKDIDEAWSAQLELDAMAKSLAKSALLEKLGITEDESKLLLS